MALMSSSTSSNFFTEHSDMYTTALFAMSSDNALRSMPIESSFLPESA